MDKNFLSLGKENRYEYPGSPKVPNKIPKTPIVRHITIKLSKIKDKERLLKVVIKEPNCYIQRNSHKITNRFLSKDSASRKGVT